MNEAEKRVMNLLLEAQREFRADVSPTSPYLEDFTCRVRELQRIVMAKSLHRSDPALINITNGVLGWS